MCFEFGMRGMLSNTNACTKHDGAAVNRGAAGTSKPSPYFVRTSWTHAQQASVLANWAARNGSKRVTIIASDWAPGHEAAGVFTTTFNQAGGSIVEALKVPLANPDFAPFLQRVKDAKPDAMFVFVPASTSVSQP